jgi:hypothetical protein
MTQPEIKQDVESTLNNWIALQSGLDRSVELTIGARAFLTTLIKNISEDTSNQWPNDINSDAIQRFAISLLPNILNEVLVKRIEKETNTFVISSWEIAHSLTKILDMWCPIKKTV